MKIISKLKRYINKINPNSDFYYSQNGEDILLNVIFNNINNGFYIDVGAYHPIRFSNTYRLYQRGWRGINIDAMPGSMHNFKKIRPSDINLEVPIYDADSKLNYYMFEEQAYNTLDKNVADKLKLKGNHPIKNIEITTKKLDAILDDHLPINVEIDILDIDVEGIDFNVLKSINLNKYRPKVIMVEVWSKSLKELMVNEITVYLSNFNYNIYSKLHDTVFFLRDDFFSKRFGK